MRRFTVFVSASVLLATVLLVPMAAGVSAATASAAGFACDPHGTTGGSPTTTLSTVRIDTTTPANSQLTCLFRGTRLPLSTGRTCSFDNAAYHLDFARRTLLPVNGNTNLLCSGGTVSAKTDLQITKTDGGTTAVAGTSTTYTITVTNAGSVAAPNATVSDLLPAGATSASWSASNGHSGTGALSDAITGLAAGVSVTYTVIVQIDPSATGSLTNTATVAAGANTIDTDPANNSATDIDTLSRQADLAITKTDGSTSAVPGTNRTYTITVTNNGPSTVTGAVVSDILPAGTTFVSATNGATYVAGTNTAHFTTGTLAPGGTTSFQLTLAVDPSLTGTLSNTATVSPPAGVIETDPANNSTTDSDTLTRQADLAITKTDGSTTAVPGTGTTYTLVVTNIGPSAVTGASLSDPLPAGVTSATWTFVSASGGGAVTGPISGTGALATTLNLPVGATLTFTFSVQVSASATGSLANTATVTPPAGTTDPTPGNNSATDTDQIVLVADLSITVDDGKTTVVAGSQNTYTAVISNNGPNTVHTLHLLPVHGSQNPSDALLAPSYTPSDGAYDADVAIWSGLSLASGQSITMTVVGTVPAVATMKYGLDVSILFEDVTDPDFSNNQAFDIDTVTPAP